MYYLCELCFDYEKLVIYDYVNCYFFKHEFHDKIAYFGISLLKELKVLYATL